VYLMYVCMCICNVCMYVYMYVQSFTEDSGEKVDLSINASDLCLRGFPLQIFITILIQM
jgi:hypothetical protein